MERFKEKKKFEDEPLYKGNIRFLSIQTSASGYFYCIAEECEKVASEIYHTPSTHWPFIIKMQYKKTIFCEVLKQNQ